MKKFLGALAFVSVLFAFENANAAACDNLIVGSSCWQTITEDSGNGKLCNSGDTGCLCADMDGVLKSAAPCWTNWIEIGQTITGKVCCFNTNVTHTDETSVETNASANLNSVFAPTHTDTFFGYVGTSLRSSNSGRAASAKAKLDACLFYSDVDSIEALGGTDADKYGYCAGSTYGCGSTMKNEHCNSNGGAVCVDRCACVYSGNGIDTCNGL